MKKLPEMRCKKGYWYVRIAKKDFYLGKNESAARKKYLSLLRENLGKIAGDGSDGPVLLSHVFAGYIASLENFVTENYIADRKFTCRILLDSVHDMPAKKFTPKVFAGWLEKLKQKKLVANSIRNYRLTVLAAFRWAQTQELIPSGFYHDLTAVPVPRGAKRNPKIKPPKKEDFEKILKALRAAGKNEAADILEIQALTGMRPSEVCRLKKSNFKRIEGSNVWEISFQKHKTFMKTGEPTKRFVGRKAMRILEKYFQFENLFTLNSPRVSQIVFRIAKKEGIPFHQYQLRHYAGTRAREVLGLDAAQVVLGHESRKTSEIYAEKDVSLAVDFMEKYG